MEVVMDAAAYTVTVLEDGSLSCHQRIELEVQFARELEDLLGGPEEVAALGRAALQAQGHAPDAERWENAMQQVTKTLRGAIGVSHLDFRVRFDDASAPRLGS
jgi:GTP cyclohydrolase III